jgi:hypothetical protein
MASPTTGSMTARKGWFLSRPPPQEVLNLSHLRVWAPSAEYMLAMKCVSARFDSHDADDVEFLLRHLKITRAEEAFRIVAAYYPHSTIPSKSRFLIEEILGGAG